MSDSEDAILFHGLPVPDGNGRRMLYSSDHRVIYTYKLSSAELDQAFKMAVTSDGPDGLWKIKSDDRVMVRQRRQAHLAILPSHIILFLTHTSRTPALSLSLRLRAVRRQVGGPEGQRHTEGLVGRPS